MIDYFSLYFSAFHYFTFDRHSLNLPPFTLPLLFRILRLVPNYKHSPYISPMSFHPLSPAPSSPSPLPVNLSLVLRPRGAPLLPFHPRCVPPLFTPDAPLIRGKLNEYFIGTWKE